ncbi:MAG TPA: YggS family pyridoxal phosphate-dependent enzyme [Propionibacteriaceae bacterium]|nr:YggS family pyridoxal phosphate-dependent enzyme [Propionibacteriaceae bacterium]HEX5908028.1 YggS family pyridoxal phosphate-dependent enzyme [Propionibacteriaceae bacterium]
MGSVAENLAAVEARIKAACTRVGRDPSEVRLLPVSKNQGMELIAEAYEAGVRLFGENRVQEAAEKARHFADHPDLKWAIIGHLQTNKARQVAAMASEFHALSSVRVAAALQQALDDQGRSLDVFLQVNSSGEPQKFGLPPDEVEPFAIALKAYRALRVRGLMTLAVLSDDQREIRACFERMRDLQRRLHASEDVAGTYEELSMGMSGDLELAIEYGATTVRVGQAIFGPRPSPDLEWLST